MGKYEAVMGEILTAIVERFGGREVPNNVLKAWLCATFPTHFASGRADGFVEFVAVVDYATTSASLKGGGQPPKGYAFLKGIKRDKNGEIVPDNTKGASRSWQVPSAMPDRLATKAEAFGKMGAAVPAPLPTKKRMAIRFGEYIAAAKRKEDTDE